MILKRVFQISSALAYFQNQALSALTIVHGITMSFAPGQKIIPLNLYAKCIELRHILT